MYTIAGSITEITHTHTHLMPRITPASSLTSKAARNSRVFDRVYIKQHTYRNAGITKPRVFMTKIPSDYVPRKR